jgi:Uma2 family endonuclease
MVRRLIAKLDNILGIGPCEPLVPPVDVRLFPESDDSDDVVVQPDVVVVFDESKLSDDMACRGAPEVVFEVMSDSTALYDLNVKKALYEKAGVKEYWIIAKGYAIRWLLHEGKFVEAKFERDENGIELDIVTLGVKFRVIT